MHTDTATADLVDIAIIGGGPVGAALALALRDSDLRVTVLEAGTTQSTRDLRPVALSYGSRLLLERLGAWETLTRDTVATAIRQIHVSQRGGFGRAAIGGSGAAADVGVPELGYVFDFNDIFSALSKAARAAGSDYREGARASALTMDGDYRRIDYVQAGVPAALRARLVVIADGGAIEGAGLSPPKTIDYAQHALTARVRSTLPHQHTAFERFTSEGPLALLPFGAGLHDWALVWTLTPTHAATLLDADAPTFLAALREAFGTRLGEFSNVTQRACFPLSLRYAAAHGAPGIVTIGNAAQTLHPVAGQGFNLGLRDAWELARLLRTTPTQALGDSECLRRYSAARRIDRRATIAVTHGLVRLFSNDFFPLPALRGAGIAAFGSIPPLRDFLARRMIFGARG